MFNSTVSNSLEVSLHHLVASRIGLWLFSRHGSQFEPASAPRVEAHHRARTANQLLTYMPSPRSAEPEFGR